MALGSVPVNNLGLEDVVKTSMKYKVEVFARRPEDVWKTEKVLHFPNAKKTSSSFGRILDVIWTLLVSMDVQMTSYWPHSNHRKTF